MKSTSSQLLLLVGTALATGLAVAQTPTGLKVDPRYSVAVFTRSVAGQYTAPDSIAVTRDRVYIGYGDNNAPDGSDGKSNQIVEYTHSGQVVHIFTVKGHNDGLKIDPITHKLWALQNEDLNPNLVIIDPQAGTQQVFTFGPTPHGGGYDDIVFRGGDVFFSASNPANNPNFAPAIVKASFSGTMINVSPVLEGDATATDILTGQSVTLNLQDPDSMTLDPQGDVLLDSQADSELILVRHPLTTSQTVIQIPLSSPYGTPQFDDTIFTPNADGFILVADTPADVVYAIHKAEFAPGAAYSAAVVGTEGFVGRLDLEYGQVTPIVTGMQSPHGMGFVRTGHGDDDDDSPWGQFEHSCQNLFGLY